MDAFACMSFRLILSGYLRNFTSLDADVRVAWQDGDEDEDGGDVSADLPRCLY